MQNSRRRRSEQRRHRFRQKAEVRENVFGRFSDVPHDDPDGRRRLQISQEHEVSGESWPYTWLEERWSCARSYHRTIAWWSFFCLGPLERIRGLTPS